MLVTASLSPCAGTLTDNSLVLGLKDWVCSKTSPPSSVNSVLEGIEGIFLIWEGIWEGILEGILEGTYFSCYDYQYFILNEYQLDLSTIMQHFVKHYSILLL